MRASSEKGGQKKTIDAFFANRTIPKGRWDQADNSSSEQAWKNNWNIYEVFSWGFIRSFHSPWKESRSIDSAADSSSVILIPAS